MKFALIDMGTAAKPIGLRIILFLFLGEQFISFRKRCITISRALQWVRSIALQGTLL